MRSVACIPTTFLCLALFGNHWIIRSRYMKEKKGRLSFYFLLPSVWPIDDVK